MRRIIHHVRRQPEHIKRHILHVLVIASGIILLLFWVYSLGTRLSDRDTQAKLGNNLKPFSVLKDNLVGGYINIAQPDLSTKDNN